MNTDLAFEIAYLALSVAEDIGKHNSQDGVDIKHTLLEIMQRTAEVYRQHTGKPLDPSLIHFEEPLGPIPPTRLPS
jgi:hypothetical protein